MKPKRFTLICNTGIRKTFLVVITYQNIFHSFRQVNEHLESKLCVCPTADLFIHYTILITVFYRIALRYDDVLMSVSKKL